MNSRSLDIEASGFFTSMPDADVTMCGAIGEGVAA